MLMTVLVVGGILAVLALLAGRKTIARVWMAGSAQLNKGGRALAGADAVAVYQKQIDDATEEIKGGKEGLTQYKGLVSQYERKVEANEKEVNIYDSRARVHVSAGRDKEATEALAAKKKAETTLASDRKQLELYQKSYSSALKKMQAAQQKIAQAKEEAQHLSADLKMSQAEAEIAELASSFNFKGASLDGLSEAREEIQRQIDSNRAKAQVSADLGEDGMAEVDLDNEARSMAASADLAKMKEEMGLTKKEDKSCGSTCNH